jgi:hypothetical protein
MACRESRTLCLTLPRTSTRSFQPVAPLPLLARGKVRDNYAVGDDRLLMVASDRLSAFDVVMAEPIPGKGEMLTRMALFWFARLAHVVPNHLTGDDPESVVAPDERAQVRGRAMLVRRRSPARSCGAWLPGRQRLSTAWRHGARAAAWRAGERIAPSERLHACHQGRRLGQ